jgi:hypothetical protein
MNLVWFAYQNAYASIYVFCAPISSPHLTSPRAPRSGDAAAQAALQNTRDRQPGRESPVRWILQVVVAAGAGASCPCPVVLTDAAVAPEQRFDGPSGAQGGQVRAVRISARVSRGGGKGLLRTRQSPISYVCLVA